MIIDPAARIASSPRRTIGFEAHNPGYGSTSLESARDDWAPMTLANHVVVQLKMEIGQPSERTLELAVYFEANFATEAGTSIRVVHGRALAYFLVVIIR